MNDFFKTQGQKANATAHNDADTDADRSAIHHTLGVGSNQAAPGNHKHANSGEWIDFASNWPNVSTGSTQWSRYCRIGNFVRVQQMKTLNAVPGANFLDPPLAFRAGTPETVIFPIGTIVGLRTGVAVRSGFIATIGLTGMTRAVAYTADGVRWDATNPVSWQSGDVWCIEYSYECAP